MKIIVYFIIFFYFSFGDIFFKDGDKQEILIKLKDNQINSNYIRYRNSYLIYAKDNSLENDILPRFKMHWGHINKIKINNDFAFEYFYNTKAVNLPDFKKHYTSFNLVEESYNDLKFTYTSPLDSDRGPTFIAGNVNYQSNDYVNYNFDLDIFAVSEFQESFFYIFNKGKETVSDKTGLINFIINKKQSIITKETAFIYWLEGDTDVSKFSTTLLIFMVDAINRLSIGNFPSKVINSVKTKDVGFISSRVSTDAEIIFNLTVAYDFLKSTLSSKNNQKVQKALIFYQKFFLSKVSQDIFSEEERIDIIKTIFAISLMINDNETVSKMINFFISGDNSILWDGVGNYLEKHFDEFSLPKPDIAEEVKSSYLRFLEFIYILEKNQYKVSLSFPKILNTYQKYKLFFPSGDLPGFLQRERINVKNIVSITRKLLSLALLNNNSEKIENINQILSILSTIQSDKLFFIDSFADLFYSYSISKEQNKLSLEPLVGRYFLSHRNSDTMALVGYGNTPDGDNSGLYTEFYRDGIVFSRDLNFEKVEMNKKVIAHNTVVLNKNNPSLLRNYTPSLNAQVVNRNSVDNAGNNFYSNVTFIKLKHRARGGVEQQRLVAIMNDFNNQSYFLDIFRNRTTDRGDYLLNSLGVAQNPLILTNVNVGGEIRTSGVNANQNTVGNSGELGYNSLIDQIASPKITSTGFYLIKNSYIYSNINKGITNSSRINYHYMSLSQNDIVQRAKFNSKVVNIESYDGEVYSTIISRENSNLWQDPFISILSKEQLLDASRVAITDTGQEDVIFLRVRINTNHQHLILSSPDVKNSDLVVVASPTLGDDRLIFKGTFTTLKFSNRILQTIYAEQTKRITYSDYTLSNKNNATMLLTKEGRYIDIATTQDDTFISFSNRFNLNNALGISQREAAIFFYNKDNLDFQKIGIINNDLSINFVMKKKGNYKIGIFPSIITDGSVEEKKIDFYMNDQLMTGNTVFYRKGKAKFRLEIFFNYGIINRRVLFDGKNILESDNFNVLENNFTSIIAETTSALINLEKDIYSFNINIEHSFGIEERVITMENFNNKGIIVYPNPFNPSSGDILTYLASENDNILGVKVDYIIKTISGKTMKILTKENGKVTWDGKDQYDNLCSPGVYYLFRQYFKDGFYSTRTAKIILKK